jgi:hypothetical protein
MDTIVIVNRSSVADAEISNIIPALQAQVSEDFAPVWGVDATIEFVAKRAHAPQGAWQLEVFDHTDVQGAGGYHVDNKGRVSGKAFWLDAVEGGEQPSVDVSHEMLEMLADPTTATMIDLQGQWQGYQCLREVCDAVESDELGYPKPGVDGTAVLLSDFVLPAYFFQGNPSAGKYDFRGQIGGAAPTLLQGGYLGIYDPTTRQWSQVSDFDLATGRRSRRALRHGRTAWHIKNALAVSRHQTRMHNSSRILDSMPSRRDRQPKTAGRSE